MLAYKCLAVDYKRDRVFEVRTERQHRAFNRQRRHRAGRISTRTSENYRTECTSSYDRIVDPPRDGPFADQKCICGSGEPLQCIRVFVCNWFARPVGAGHNQRFRSARGEEQVLEWCVRQHYTEIVIVRRNTFEFESSRHNHNWTSQRGEQYLGVGSKQNQPACNLDVLGHDGKRFFLAELSLAQAAFAAGFRASQAR